MNGEIRRVTFNASNPQAEVVRTSRRFAPSLRSNYYSLIQSTMNKSELQDLATQRSFDLERAVEKIERQEGEIAHLRRVILDYSEQVNNLIASRKRN
jgi:hypothetical protein